jgi:uncharacterized protein
MNALRIEVLWSGEPRQVASEWLDLPLGATVEDACAAWAQRGHSAAGLLPSIWGEAAKPKRVLKPGDRLELTRALRVDPMVARRERFAKQGARGTGLFAKRRAGGKTGY